MISIKEISDTSVTEDKTDYSLVELRTAPNGSIYPYCKIHGAMNKVAVFKDRGNAGLWRCLQFYCRAGCEQV